MVHKKMHLNFLKFLLRVIKLQTENSYMQKNPVLLASAMSKKLYELSHI